MYIRSFSFCEFGVASGLAGAVCGALAHFGGLPRGDYDFAEARRTHSHTLIEMHTDVNAVCHSPA